MIWVGANLYSLRCDLTSDAGFLPTPDPEGGPIPFCGCSLSFLMSVPSEDWWPFTPGWPWVNSTGAHPFPREYPRQLMVQHYSCSRDLQCPSLCILGGSALYLSCQCPVALATATSVPFCLSVDLEPRPPPQVFQKGPVTQLL